MAYGIIIENAAQKEIKRLVKPWDIAAKKAIDGLEFNPRPSGVKKLSGSKDGYRVRVGDYRILFTIDDKEKLVSIYKVSHRRDVYR